MGENTRRVHLNIKNTSRGRVCRIYQTLPVTSVNPERSFSRLKLRKNCLSGHKARLSNLTVFSTERDVSMDKRDEEEEDGAVISGNITAHSSGTRSSLTCSNEFLDTGHFGHWTLHVFPGLDSHCPPLEEVIIGKLFRVHYL